VLALVAQQITEYQTQQQTLMAKLVQLQLTLGQPKQPQQQPVIHSKEFSSSPSLELASTLELLPSRSQQQPPPVTAPFELPKSAEPQRPQQQQQQGGLDFGTGFGGPGAGYDPIKSLLSQLQESTNEFHHNQARSPSPPPQQQTSLFGGNSGTVSGAAFAGFGGQHTGSRPGSSHQAPEFSESGAHRSIWDLPVSGLRDEQPSPEPKVCRNSARC
jgi:hypothetical protein